MGKKTYIGRENIHTGLSGLKDDNKWSDMLNFRSVNRRTNVVSRKLELFKRDAGFHSIFRAYDNRIYALGSKESMGFHGGETRTTFKLWRVTQTYLGERNERSPSTQHLTIRGNYIGETRQHIRINIVKGKLTHVNITDEERNWGVRPVSFLNPGVLMLVLDQTSSIGTDGAQAGLDIIDNTNVIAMGYVSFGDPIIQIRPITTDLATVRAELQFAVDNPDLPPFFGDGGGDIPENGIEAIDAGLDELDAFTDYPLQNRSLYFKTDTAGYIPFINTTLLELNERLNELQRVWLDFGEDVDETEDGFYATDIPETDVVLHEPYQIP